MTTAADAREFRELPLALLDAPALDARIDRSDEFLDALASDIARRGVLVPIIVVRVGERYEVVDGKTRWIVCNRLRLDAVPCCIYPTRDLALEGVKYAATQFHENFTPADEAIYFNQLFEHECGCDIEKVAALVNKSRNYVSARLELVQGDAAVFEALRAKTISIGVAQELNKIDDESYRHYFLRFAVKDGATVSTVRGWVQMWRQSIADHVLPNTDAAPSEPPVLIVSSFNPLRCAVCGESNHYIPEQVPIHTHCRIAILEKLLAAYRGESS